MTWFHPDWLEYQRKRFSRPDGYPWPARSPADDSAAPFSSKSHAPAALLHAGDEPSELDLLPQWLELARLRLDWELLKLSLKAQKAGFDPNQPRDDRGRWTDMFGDGPLHVVVAGMPRIPRQKPPDSRDPTATYQQIAEWIGENGPAILDGIARTSWLYPAIPTIWSYLDAPKSLEDLQEDLSSKAGYDVHHIVERVRPNRMDIH
jgi:hypothetical protein